jgi:hypothetical protein
MGRKSLLLIIMLILSIGLIGACSGPDGQASDEVEGVADDVEVMTTPQGLKYIVPPEKLIGGGPPKDGIPSIDNPKFVSVEEADEWIQDDELVLALTYKGVTRVYPLQIMTWHEIVNDTIAGDPILITY